MKWKYSIGILLILGIAFLGVFLASPSIDKVQADDFVLLDGYSGIFTNASGENKSFTFYNVSIPKREDEAVKVPAEFVGVDGHFLSTLFGLNTYANPIGSPDNWVEKKLLHLDFLDGMKYELVTAYKEDGRIDPSKTVLGVIPEEFHGGRPISIDPPPDMGIGSSKEDELIQNEIPSGNGTPTEPMMGLAAEVCFDPSVVGLPQTGLCDYFFIATFTEEFEVRPEDIPELRRLISAFLDRIKPKTSEDLGDFDTGTPHIGPQTGPPIDHPDKIVEIDGQIIPKQNTGANPSSDPAKTAGDEEGGLLPPSSTLPLYAPNLLTALFSSTTIFYETFEGAFPGNWLVGDADSGNGLDYWDDTSTQSHFGSWSAWASDIGIQWNTVITDLFNGSISGWSTWDANPNSGYDFWGYSTNKYSSSPGSAYSAGNSSTGYLFRYDNDMAAFFTKNTTYNASSWLNARVSFSTWYQTESGYDKLLVIASPDNGNSWYVLCEYSGSSPGWTTKSCSIPSNLLTSQFKYGFHFVSDSTITYEGAYVDNVKLEREVANTIVNNYDDDQYSYMIYGPINLSGYSNTVFEFWLKGNVEPGYDFLSVNLSADGTSWVTIDTIDNTYSDWQKKSYPFTSTSGRIYLNLVMETDNSIHSYTGYYVDDVKVFGESLLPDGALCSNSSQCQSGVCGGARTDYYIHCNQDQSPTAYGDEIIYANTCGGAGTYSHTNYDGVSQACSAGKVCDADLAYTSSSFTTSLICKNNLYNACTTNPDCWNDNGGVDCKGTSGNKICTYGTDGSYCTENAQCNSNTCINNQCSTGLPNGSLCALDSQCQSRYCVYDTPTQSHCMAPASYSPFILNYDTWDAATSNGTSTNLDQVAFTSTKVRPVTYNLRESTDMLCYDYNNDGVFDACYYDPLGCGGSGCASTSCNSFSIPNSVSAGKKYSCILDDYFGCLTGVDVPDQICTGAGCVVDTAFPSHREARVKAYYDCDNSDGLRAEHTILNSPPNEPRDDYWVVNPKFNYCESQTQPEREYWVLGAFGPNYSDIKTVNGPISCQSGTSCSILADEQYISTPGGSIPSACKTNPGGSCTQNSNCLYNACQGNICQDGFIYEAFLIDELSNPLSNYTINLTTCSDSLVTSAVTDADGKFVFAAGASNYKMKLVVPWGEMLFDTGPNDCSPFGTGFLGGNIWQFHETTVVQGKAITPQGNPSPGLPFDLGACTDNTLITNTTSNSFGDFLLQSPSDRYRLNVTLNDARISLTDTQNNACFLFYGELDLGEMELVNDCSLYNNSCYLGDYRLNSCSFDPENGCTCSIQYCEAGCSEGAPQCNLVGTGTIHAIVMDSNSPIRNAPIYLNNSLSGKTDGKGKHDINKKHGSYTLTAACPDGSSPTTKPIFLGGNHAYGYFDLDNCPVQEKGDLLIRAENVNGYPVANVVVEIDGDEIGYTNGFGQLYIKDLDFGSREVRAIYKITNEVGTGAYQIYSLADVNQSEVVLTLSILKPSDPGFGGQAYTGNVLFIPAAVVIVAPFALAAIDAISVAWSTQDLCTCILDYDYTLNELGQCMADFVTPTCQDIRTCENGLTKWGDEINNGKCWAESIFLAGDVASPLIPVGLIGHAGLFLLNKVPDFKILDRLAEGSKVLQKGVDFIEYQLSNGKLIRGEIVDASAQTIKRGPAVGVKIANLTDEGILSAERVVQKHGPGGENALKSLINRTDGDFTITKEYMEDTFNGLGKIKQGGLPGIELAKVEKKLAHDVKGGNFGNIKGILGEIEVGAKPEFVSQLAEFQYRPPGAVSPVEWKLLNGDLVEVKTTNMLTTTYANYIEKIEDIGKKVNDWSTHAPSAKINIRFTKPINNEVKNDIMAEIVKAAPGININMITIVGYG